MAFRIKATERHLNNMLAYGIVHHAEHCYWNSWKRITTKEEATIFEEWPINDKVSKDVWYEEFI